MRTSGILLPVSSLPSPCGIGTFGDDAYRFIDFLECAKQSHWQILPLGCTGYADSPYQSLSTFAGNPYFIDLDMLQREGLLKKEEYQRLFWGADVRAVDYGVLYRQRYGVLKRAFSRFDKTDENYLQFCSEQAHWLTDFSLYRALKEYLGGSSWQQWPVAYRLRRADLLGSFALAHEEDIAFWNFTQYQFFRQWEALKRYAHQKEISIIGDLPIYVAEDSADVWAHPQLFALDADCRPSLVAGVPPDAFSAEGQLWGNPVYNWEEAAREHYAWWIARMRMAFSLYDRVRLDHFRGFSSYYALAADAVNAVGGQWIKGPGMAFFSAVEKALGSLPIIAENLGLLTEDVGSLLTETGYPGMRVLHFGLASDDAHNENLPCNIEDHNVVYAGTHDNDTTAGWFASLTPDEQQRCLFHLHTGEKDRVVCAVLCEALKSKAGMAILSMPDLLPPGQGKRLNTPATLQGNWQWRAVREDFTSDLSDCVAQYTGLYGRG